MRRAFGETLAGLLPFSLDLVDVCIGYAELGYLCATPDAKPKLLLSFTASGDGYAYGVSMSPDNKLWVATGTSVQVFSSEGKFLHFAAQGKLERAVTVAFGRDGSAFIADLNKVVVCKPDGDFAYCFCGPDLNDDEFTPRGLALDGDSLLVSDHHCSRILKFHTNGKLEERVPIGDLHCPHGLLLLRNGNLVVCDKQHNFVKVTSMFALLIYDANRCLTKRELLCKPLERIDTREPDGVFLESSFGPRLCQLTVTKASLFPIDQHRIHIFTQHGQFISEFGSHGTGPGQFRIAYGVCVDAFDRIYVCDSTRRVQVFAFA